MRLRRDNAAAAPDISQENAAGTADTLRAALACAISRPPVGMSNREWGIGTAGVGRRK